MAIKAKEYLEKERGRLTLGRTLRSIRLGEEESQTNHDGIHLLVQLKEA